MERILVAVYGSLKKGFHNNHLINNEEGDLLGTHISEPKYTMFSMGGFPAVIEDGNTPIKLEVYEVSTRVKFSLDRLEGFKSKGNPHNFYDITTVDTPYGKATMYVLVDKNEVKGLPIVNSGDWSKDNLKY